MNILISKTPIYKLNPPFLGSICTKKPNQSNSTDTFSYSANQDNSYNFFKERIKAVYPEASVEDTIRKITENSDNRINEGTEKTVYKIPGLQGYVIGKIKNPKHTKNSMLKGCDNHLPKYNFGQPIADNGSDLIIMKEVKGTTHSIEDWVKVFCDTKKSGSLDEKQASVIYEKIAAIEDFPVESYIKLAEKIKYLSDKSIKVDNFNPNNLLVDFENQEFNIIDFSDKPTDKTLKHPRNSVHDMINLLCDALLNADCYEALDDKRAEIFFNNTKNIIEKCYIAADIVGLPKDNENIVRVHKLADTLKWNKKLFDNVMTNSYKRFCQLYEV